MIFNFTLTIALIIFCVGTAYKVFNLVNNGSMKRLEKVDSNISKRKNEFHEDTGKGFISKIFFALKSFFVSIILQTFFLKEKKGLSVWITHFFISLGIMMLIVLHALDGIVASNIFQGYVSTKNPYFFLREIFGAMVLVGIVLSITRKIRKKRENPQYKAGNWGIIFLIFGIVLSGFILEGYEMSSYSTFENMVIEYSRADADEIDALELFWIEKNALASPNEERLSDQDLIAEGRVIHEMECAYCHSNNKWGFLGFTFAKAAGPMSGTLEKIDLGNILWYVHFLLCFAGLALLPFSKLFHILLAPFTFLSARYEYVFGSNRKRYNSKPMIEKYTCNHGGVCHHNCPVYLDREKILKERQNNEGFLSYLEDSFRKF